MLSKFYALLLIASVAYGQSIINIIQFSDDYCLCPNQQKLSLVGECLAVLGGYQTYRISEGVAPAPDQVYVQDCTDKLCTECVNQTTYNALPPCQADKSGLFYYSVLPEDDVTTYFNAPSVVTARYANTSCSGDIVHYEIEYGLSCFVTAEGSYYYSCPEDVTTEFSYFNCTDNACQECEENIMPTQQCVNDEGVWKSVQCTASSSSTTTGQTATATNGQTVSSATNGGNTNNNVNSASASVSTTTSASSHNVSSSASAAGGSASAGSATSGGAVHMLFSDVRGGMMKKKEPRANPPFCNGGLPQTTAASAAATSASAGGSSGGSGGSSGGNGRKGGIKLRQ